MLFTRPSFAFYIHARIYQKANPPTPHHHRINPAMLIHQPILRNIKNFCISIDLHTRTHTPTYTHGVLGFNDQGGRVEQGVAFSGLDVKQINYTLNAAIVAFVYPCQ